MSTTSAAATAATAATSSTAPTHQPTSTVHKSNEDGDEDRSCTFFIHVKTKPEWLAFSVADRFATWRRDIQPVVTKHAATVKFEWYDTEFYSTRVTDVAVLHGRTHQDVHMFIEGLRETRFWDGYFEVVEILAGERNAAIKNYTKEAALSGFVGDFQ